MQLRLGSGDIILDLGGPDIITTDLIRGNQKESASRESNETTEAEVGVMSFEDGGRGHKPRNAGGH